MNDDHWSSFIVWCLMSVSWVGVGWGVLTVVSYRCSASDVAPGFRYWALVVFMVLAAVSECVGICSCSFWGICRCLGSHHRCLGIRTMTNDGFESVVRHLVAMSLSATWHLGCVSVKKGEGDDLLCMVTTLSVVTVGWCCVVG